MCLCVPIDPHTKSARNLILFHFGSPSGSLTWRRWCTQYHTSEPQMSIRHTPIDDSSNYDGWRPPSARRTGKLSGFSLYSPNRRAPINEKSLRILQNQRKTKVFEGLAQPRSGIGWTSPSKTYCFLWFSGGWPNQCL